MNNLDTMETDLNAWAQEKAATIMDKWRRGRDFFHVFEVIHQEVVNGLVNARVKGFEDRVQLHQRVEAAEARVKELEREQRVFALSEAEAKAEVERLKGELAHWAAVAKYYHPAIQKPGDLVAQLTAANALLRECRTFMVSTREALRGLVALSNVNEATREILRSVGNQINEQVTKIDAHLAKQTTANFDSIGSKLVDEALSRLTLSQNREGVIHVREVLRSQNDRVAEESTPRQDAASVRNVQVQTSAQAKARLKHINDFASWAASVAVSAEAPAETQVQSPASVANPPSEPEVTWADFPPGGFHCSTGYAEPPKDAPAGTRDIARSVVERWYAEWNIGGPHCSKLTLNAKIGLIDDIEDLLNKQSAALRACVEALEPFAEMSIGLKGWRPESGCGKFPTVAEVNRAAEALALARDVL